MSHQTQAQTPSNPRPRVDGARVLLNLPVRAPVALPTTPSRSSQVLQSRRAPAQLSLFPPPSLALRGGR